MSAPNMAVAVTAYGVTIPRAFASPKAAKAWAEENKTVFPGCKVLSGKRTIWKDTGRAA